MEKLGDRFREWHYKEVVRTVEQYGFDPEKTVHSLVRKLDRLDRRSRI